MSSLLAKRIVSSSSPLQNHHLALLNPLLLRLSLSTQTQQRKESAFVAQYLISSLGFSSDQALKVSSDKKLVGIKSSSGPDSVVQFLKEVGLSDANVKSTISFSPSLLSLNVDKTLNPKLRELTAAGFTGEILVNLIRRNPFVFELKNPVVSLQFWREFVGDIAFLKIIQRNGLLVTRDIDSFATPRINLLKEYGFSDHGIGKLLTKGGSRFLLNSFESFSHKLKLTEELGFSRGSNMFLHGLLIIGGYKKETIEKKSEFFQKMYGWSEEEVRLAFRKFPNILAKSEESVIATMDFLIKNVGLEPRSIASQPLFFSYSLEKRLVPRHHVLSILKEHAKKDYKLLPACGPSEKIFVKRYIVPYEKDVPGIAEAYAAACSREVPC